MVCAQFTSVPGATIRKETRLYLTAGSLTKASGTCLGVVWLCNPGSAHGTSSWGPCKSDPTLDIISEVYLEANRMAKAAGRSGAALDGYLQILNLYYVCDPCSMTAWNTHLTLISKHVELPPPTALFCWLAWGHVQQALLFEAAPLLAPRTDHFYYDGASKSVMTGLSCLDFPMHPYGASRHSRSHPDYVSLLAQHMATKLP
jgi:hypothetical protein